MNAALLSKYQFSSPYFRWLGYGVWFVMLVMAVLFYKERATFMDGGFQLTELINKGGFEIYYYRMTNPLTQILALAAIKMKMSLKAVMVAYSVNFILFFAFVYHLITSWCKNDVLGWVQIAFFTLLTTDTFYFLPPEYYQGMSLLLLWFAIILRFDFQKRWLLPLLALLLIPIIFDHLLLSTFFVFLWCFFFLHEEKLRVTEYWNLAVVMIIIIISIHQEYFVSWYDEMKMENFESNWQLYFPNFQNIPAHLIFLKKCLTIYYFFPIVLLALIAGYSTQFWGSLKSTLEDFTPLLKLGLVLGFSACYLLISHIGDPESTHFFYSEISYTGLAVPIVMALLIDFVQPLKKSNIALTILALVMIVRLGTITNTHNKFEGRHDWMRHQMHESGSNKLIIHAEDAPKDIYIMDWSIPYESLLITALEGPQNAKSMIIATEEKQYKDFLDRDDLLLEVMRQTELDDLNKRYFDLGGGKYVIQ